MLRSQLESDSSLEDHPIPTPIMCPMSSKKQKLSSKRNWVSEELPEKMKDPGSFTIPCIIGGVEIQKALFDSGASINLMPLSVAKQLSLGELIPTTITLQMADRSMVKPEGVLEDVLVTVGKFVFPVDFIILDMEEDSQVPLLLGRLFLATEAALIDMQKEFLP